MYEICYHVGVGFLAIFLFPKLVPKFERHAPRTHSSRHITFTNWMITKMDSVLFKGSFLAASNVHI